MDSSFILYIHAVIYCKNDWYWSSCDVRYKLKEVKPVNQHFWTNPCWTHSIDAYAGTSGHLVSSTTVWLAGQIEDYTIDLRMLTGDRLLYTYLYVDWRLHYISIHVDWRLHYMYAAGRLCKLIKEYTLYLYSWWSKTTIHVEYVSWSKVTNTYQQLSM